MTLDCMPDMVDAWTDAVHKVDGSGKSCVAHLTSTFQADPNMRPSHQCVGDALAARGQLTVAQVADTIFPQSLYRADADDPAGLLFENWSYARRVNSRRTGRSITYFDRFTHYPGRDGEFNQLDHQLKRLRTELASNRPFRAIYELGVTGEAELRLMVPGVDNPRRSFPCLSHISLTSLDGAIHLMAQYRYQYLIRKALGNYLGLSRLLCFFANELGLAAGKVTVNAAYARLDVEGVGGLQVWRSLAGDISSTGRKDAVQ